MSNAIRAPWLLPNFRNLTMKGYHAFGCENTVANISPAFRNGLWTVKCPVCGVINKLAPDPERRGTFIVIGAFFVTDSQLQQVAQEPIALAR